MTSPFREKTHIVCRTDCVGQSISDKAIRQIPDYISLADVFVNLSSRTTGFEPSIIEAMAQAGGILAYLTGSAEQRSRLIYFMGMDKVRFRKPVVPGDQILFKAKILKFRSKVAKMSGIATVDNQMVAEAELMASFGESK